MLNKTPILFVSAGLKKPKKAGNPFSRIHNYLNYGLLGLATILKRKGYNPIVYHGKFQEPSTFTEYIINHSNFKPYFPLFISIPSVFAIEWTKEFTELFKKVFPNTKIIVGGRWVVEKDGEWIKKQLPLVDLVVYGTAEKRIEKFLYPKQWIEIQNTDISPLLINETRLSHLPSHDYSLMPDYMDFQPSIEVSRGCGLGCSFCLEKDTPLEDMKDVDLLFKEIENVQAIFKTKQITPYFEASFFRPSSRWAAKLAQRYTSTGQNFQWRAETRIDSLSEKILVSLAKSGLKILDIGLEAASIQQLKLMNKSVKPEIYLKRASKFLKICKSLGIWTKINILLYAGETADTINETTDWLNEHKECIKGVSVNPLTVYGRDKNTQLYLDELKKLGAEPVENNFLSTGYSRMHLSKQISFEKSEEYRIKLCKMFMSHDDYYDLKSFSYWSNSFTREKFDEICLKNKDSLPFSYG